MNYYLYPPFFIVDPQNSFDEAWEVFCCEMLNLENNTNLIRRRRPPDLGADLIWDSEKIIYQCKSVSTGEYGKFDLTKAKESIDKAIENQAHLNWERYVLCTNVDLTGDQERKLKEYLPCIEFRTKGYWINLCKKFSESVSSRFRFLSDTSYTLKFWNMPYYRNPYFNGRENILTTIYARWHKPSATSIFRRQALYGLGGIGKTQIAIEYAYRYREVYSAVFWCRAASQETLTTDLLKIAEVLHISNKTSYNASTNQPQIIAEVKNWFIRNKDWLIIFDNVEDVNLIFDFLPTEENGYVLVTTRDQFIAHVVSSIEVEKLDNENGILLLLRRAKIISQEEYPLTIAENDLQIADTLVTLMDGLPLAIDQAGAYILEVKCSLPHYHKLYQMNQIEFLKRRSSLLNEYPESVMTTWSISFKEVEKISLASAELLRLCAFLEPDFIPEEMMIDGLKQIENIMVPRKWTSG